MSYASRLVDRSRKLRDVHKLLNQEQAAGVRWFSNGSLTSTYKRNERLCSYTLATSRTMSTTGISVGTVHGVAGLRIGRSPMPLFVLGKESFLSHMVSRRGLSFDSGLPPHQEIGMPSLSPTMTEGNIARWLKKEGDKVSPGEVLCEVETDKATVEMECMEEGYLAKILKGDGSKEIKVGEVIAITVEDEEDIGKFKDYSSSATAGKPTTPESQSSPPQRDASVETRATPEPKPVQPSTAPQGDRVLASPVARKMAEDQNIPLSSIKGTGPDGLIVKADIEDYLASGKKAPTATSKQTVAAPAELDYIDIPLSQIRKVTASRLLFSKQTIPHYYLTVDTCVDKLMDLRSQLNSLQESSGGKRISVNDLVIKAAALALRSVPQCNSDHNININIAVQTDNGLFVPVIKDADKKGLSKISEEVKGFGAEKPGTTALNHKTMRVARILAVGSAEKKVVPGSAPGEYKFASFMSVTLSCDHRVIDGAIGAEWLKAFKSYIENPESMLL
ncbi:hypothetical protein MLD38_029485 [Melastoma candidum]|uniref:Uncharacterized protein n=1 Tax=Melastoma candidum TaxID=119954 RepID=A0ACB9N5Q7_9MYRT|nr:hypothetical protein MLD38_029485 [Melastoma candidum]